MKRRLCIFVLFASLFLNVIFIYNNEISLKSMSRRLYSHLYNVIRCTNNIVILYDENSYERIDEEISMLYSESALATHAISAIEDTLLRKRKRIQCNFIESAMNFRALYKQERYSELKEAAEEQMTMLRKLEIELDELDWAVDEPKRIGSRIAKQILTKVRACFRM